MIIADTGFFFALANAKDRFHEAASRAAQQLREPLICTWPVLTETCQLLTSRLGVQAELAFIQGVRTSGMRIFALEAKHLERIGLLMAKYRELPMDLVDASLVIVAEELGSGRMLSTDQRDFHTYRWKNRKPFKNLLAV